MLLGGVPVDDRVARQLADHLGRPLGTKLEQALLFRARIVALTREEKAAVLAALETAPADELQALREALLADDSWRPRRRM
jgi:hypothetical protein